LLHYKNHSEKLQQIINGELSLRENVAYFIQRIADNYHLNAFNQVFAEEALLQAEIVQQKIKERKHGKLAGLVIAVKDVLSIKDKLTTCSSNILKNFTSIYTATAVQKLIDEDAIIIGKTNCDEFAMGSSNENSVFGPVRNPADNERETALSIHRLQRLLHNSIIVIANPTFLPASGWSGMKQSRDCIIVII